MVLMNSELGPLYMAEDDFDSWYTGNVYWRFHWNDGLWLGCDQPNEHAAYRLQFVYQSDTEVVPDVYAWPIYFEYWAPPANRIVEAVFSTVYPEEIMPPHCMGAS